jgi:hypothetical protein
MLVVVSGHKIIYKCGLFNVSFSSSENNGEFLCDLQFSLYPFVFCRVIESKRFAWAELAAGMGRGGGENAYTVLVGKPEGKRSRR